MVEAVRRVLSRESGPFWQFVKYGIIGVATTLVQLAVFYLLAATCLKCLTADDWAVRFLGLPAVCFGGGEPVSHSSPLAFQGLAGALRPNHRE